MRRAFRDRGHDAYSCDLVPADDGDEEHHIQYDALTIMLRQKWDLIIAHPPCTYLSVSGMHWTKRGLRDPKLTEDALGVFRACLSANAPRICVENPMGVVSTRIRMPDQYIQPYQFGEDASKRTGLWLVNLPKLEPTEFVAGRTVCRVCGNSSKGIEEAELMTKKGCVCGSEPFNMRKRWSNQTDSGQNRLGPSERRAADRSRTYPGIAAAMAEQWGKLK